MKYFKNQKVVSIVASVILLIFVLFSVAHLKNLNTSYSVRQFFPKHHALLDADTEFKRTFELNSVPAYFAILERLPQDQGTWLDSNYSSELKRITSELSTIAGVKNVLSLANTDLAVTHKNELRIGPLFDILPKNEWKSEIESQPLLQPQLISEDMRSVLVMIEPKDGTLVQLADVQKQIETIIHPKALKFTAGLAGVPVMQQTLATKLRSELGMFLGLCLAIFILAFAFFFKNISLLGFVASGLIICNLAVLGGLSYLGVPFTVLLGTLPVVISIAFVSLCIHTFHLWSDNLKCAPEEMSKQQRWDLSIKTLSDLLVANFLGSLTTAVGFAALATTKIPAIQQYALSVTGGVMFTFVLTQFLFVIGLVHLNPVQRSWMDSQARWMLFFTRFAKPVFMFVVLLTAGLTLCSSHLNYSAQLFDEIPKSEPVHHAMNRIDKKFGGTVPLEISLEVEKGTWLEPENLQRLQTVVGQIRTTENVGSVLALSDFMGKTLPTTKAAIAETNFLFSMSQANPLRRFIDGDQKKVRLAVRFSDLTSNQVSEVRSNIRTIVNREMPEVKMEESGLGVVSYTINSEVAHELVFGFWQSIAVIGLLLIVIFRSVRYAIVACIPNVMAPLMLIGTMALIGTPVKVAIALIFSIAIGLAFNNTVYLLSRLRKLQLATGRKRLPLNEALLIEGNACLSESLLTFAGFLVFLTSSFGLNQTFGAYMILSIAGACIGDLAFMPAMIKLFPRLLQPTNKLTLVDGEKDRSTLQNLGRAAAIVVAFIFSFAAANAWAASSPKDDAQAILKTSREHVESQSDQANVTLKIIETNGDVKTRDLQLKTLRDGKTYYAIARINSPADVKGTAVLAEIKDGVENQWLYLPSSKQVRRVVSSKKSSGVLGSELSPEDLNSAALKSATAKVVKKDAKSATIEVTPSAGESEYTKVLLQLQMPEALPQEMSYFKADKEIKHVSFQDYTEAKPKIWRAKKIVVKNLENNRATEVLLSDLKVNPGFSSNDFTVAALKR